MALLQQTVADARVLVVGKNPRVNRAIAKLLELDEHIDVLGEAPSIGTAPISRLRPDMVIFDEDGQSLETARARQYVNEISPDSRLWVLETLRDVTVAELIDAVRDCRTPVASHESTHLRVVHNVQERDALASLSERELQVVRLVAEGLSNKEISSRLALSDKTIKNHISHILAKMNLTARTQVAVYAIRAGLV